MFQYTVKRIFYSILITFGVLIVTFLLFRLASGDPALTVLGKNPSPEEVEEMREKLRSHKPLFFGSLQPTLLYTSCDFREKRSTFPGVSFRGKVTHLKKGVLLEKGAGILLKKNFALKDTQEKVFLRMEKEGDLTLNRIPSASPAGKKETRSFIPEELLFVENLSSHPVLVESLAFFRPTKHFFDSQAKASFEEFLSFRKEFPYVSFFNFGKTLQTREDIRTKLLEGVLPSLCLMVPIFIGELLLGIILAMLSCAFRDTLLDRSITLLSVAGMSISYLALIIFGQWFLAYYLNLFPVWGFGTPRFLLLPIAIGILSGTGSGVRFYRTVFLDEANKEYLRTARAKGLSGIVIYGKHLLKNALIPIITRASSVIPFLFTGSLLLETFFGIPGLGYAGIKALNDADLQMLKALVLAGSMLFVFINLITDLAYAWVDPRIRLGNKD